MTDAAERAAHVLRGLAAHHATLEQIAGAVVTALRAGHKLLVCGNGGSSAEAMHLATELVGRYRSNRRSLPAVVLGADPTQLSCIANDFAWEDTFARPLAGLGARGDVLVCFSTSGQSGNVVRALKVAGEMGIASAAFLGKGGGACAPLASWSVVVASDETARIQEAHLFLVHWLCERIEEAFA